MNYLILLSELQETHSIALFSAHPGWCIQATRFDYSREVFDGGALVPEFSLTAPTPEQAIRQLYLSVNPIPKNNFNGSLAQNEHSNFLKET